jgi:hypothetical protein
MNSHPIGIPWICKHAIKHKIHVSHLHRCPATKQDKKVHLSFRYGKLRFTLRWDGAWREGGKVNKPVKEEDSSDHLVGIGPGPGSSHLLPIQDVKHTLPKENLQVSIIPTPGLGS